MSEDIERYLDELYARMRADPRTARRVLDEAADHLHATASELTATGVERAEAEREAVRRFGPGAPLARAAGRRSMRRLAAESLQALTILAAIGLVAIGLSGALAAGMNAVFGAAFVGGAPSIVATTDSSGRPFTVAEIADDAVSLRVLAGLAGVVVLIVARVWEVRRRRGAPGGDHVLPAAFVVSGAAVAFGAGTVLLTAASVDQLVLHGSSGVGFFLSGAVVCVAGAGLFGVRAVRALLPAGR
ncbi:MAG: permease prefix domain 1-containing protein [Jatrophihabitantaceae bacterium]